MEKSICINCEYNLDCSLSSITKIIWSCNEYLLAGSRKELDKKSACTSSNQKQLEFI